MKQILDLRPVYHRLEERIRAHVLLCWLALLLIRIIETTTGQTWHHVRRDLDRLHAVTFTGRMSTGTTPRGRDRGAGGVRQRERGGRCGDPQVGRRC